MDEKPIWRPTGKPMERRKEFVEIEGGAGVWVWGLTTADSLSIIERATQGGVTQESGIGRARMLQYQIMLSCFDSEQPGAKRIFNDADFAAINEGSWAAFSEIVMAINRVNGKDATEAELLKDFSGATGAPNPSV